MSDAQSTSSCTGLEGGGALQGRLHDVGPVVEAGLDVHASPAARWPPQAVVVQLRRPPRRHCICASAPRPVSWNTSESGTAAQLLLLQRHCHFPSACPCCPCQSSHPSVLFCHLHLSTSVALSIHPASPQSAEARTDIIVTGGATRRQKKRHPTAMAAPWPASDTCCWGAAQHHTKTEGLLNARVPMPANPQCMLAGRSMCEREMLRRGPSLAG